MACDILSGSSPQIFVNAEHDALLLERLKHQRDVKLFCDVILHVGAHEFPAHRNLLVAGSVYFESILNGSSSEHKSEALPLHVIVCAVGTISEPQAFRAVLDYMYVGHISLDTASITDVLWLANHFQLDPLRDYCSSFLEHQLTTCNCFQILQIAETHSLQTLFRTVDSYILANILQILESPIVLTLPEARLESLISRTMPVTEVQRLRLVCQWVGHVIDGRHHRFPPLLSHIQWDRVGPRELYSFLCSTPLLTDNERCYYHVLQSLKDSCLLPDVYFERLAELRDKYVCTSTASSSGVVPVCTPLEKNTGNDMEDDNGDGNGLRPESPVEDDTVEDEIVRLDTDEPDAEMCMGSVDIASSVIVITPITDHIGYIKNSRKKRRRCLDSIDTANSEVFDENVVRSQVTLKRKRNEVKDVDTGKTENDSSSIATSRKKRKTGEVQHKMQNQKRDVGKEQKNKLENSPSQHQLAKHINTAKRSADVGVNRSGKCKRNPSLHEGNEISADAKERNMKGTRVGRHSAASLCCAHCTFKTMKPAKMVKHMRFAHKDNNTLFSCNMCDFTCKWNRELYTHSRTTHFTGPPYSCDKCAFKADRVSLLFTHWLDHAEIKPHECTTCNMRFKLRSNMLAHMRCHSGAREFKCPTCEHTFSTKGTLDQHIVTHNDHRPFLCDLCGFSTKYQSHLTSHRRIHSGDVFRCQVENCSYSTPKRSQLACHMRSHLGLKQFVCSECGRAFVERSQLVRHERLHAAEKQFKCDRCTYESTRRDKLKEHYAKYHEEISELIIDEQPTAEDLSIKRKTTTTKKRSQTRKPKAKGDSDASEITSKKASNKTKSSTKKLKKPSSGRSVKIAKVNETTGSNVFSAVNAKLPVVCNDIQLHGIYDRGAPEMTSNDHVIVSASYPNNCNIYNNGILSVDRIPICLNDVLLVNVTDNGISSVQVNDGSPVAVTVSDGASSLCTMSTLSPLVDANNTGNVRGSNIYDMLLEGPSSIMLQRVDFSRFSSNAICNGTGFGPSVNETDNVHEHTTETRYPIQENSHVENHSELCELNGTSVNGNGIDDDQINDDDDRRTMTVL